MIDWPLKEPGDIADYLFDWSAVLQAGETIASKLVTSDGVTVDSSAIVGETVKVWLSGGVEGTAARIHCTIVTNSTPARTFVETAILPIGGGPVSLAAFKAHLRVDFDEQDLVIAAYLRAAVGMIERQTGRVLSPKVIEQRFDAFPATHLALHRDPVQEIVSIIYTDAEGAAVTVDEADTRVVEGEPYLILPAAGTSWPTANSDKGSVRVRALAGYLAGEVPPELIAAVLLMGGHLYHNREAVSQGGATSGAPVELPLGVAALCFPFRRVLIG